MDVSENIAMAAISEVIAVAQTVPVCGDVTANIAEHLRLIELAAEHRPDVILFPELSLTGYEIELATRLAFTPFDQRLDPLRNAARLHQTRLIVGAPVRLDSGLHIAAIIISPDGSVDLYTKHRLGAFSQAAQCDGVVPPAESVAFQPGRNNPLQTIGKTVAAMAICADIGNPQHIQAGVDRGANALFASMFVIPSEFPGDFKRLSYYAATHRLFVAMSNYGGPTGGLAAAGRSSILSPDGELIAQLESHGSGVAIVHHTSQGWIGRSFGVVTTSKLTY